MSLEELRDLRARLHQLVTFWVEYHEGQTRVTVGSDESCISCSFDDKSRASAAAYNLRSTMWAEIDDAILAKQ